MVSLFSRKSNIYEVVQPFFYCLKIVSYACFSIEGHPTEDKIYTSKKDIGFFVISLCINSGLLYFSFVKEYHFAESAILDFGGKIVLWCSLGIAIIAACVTFVNRRRAWSIVRKCYNFDNQLAYFGVEIEHQKHFILYFSYVLMTTVLLNVCVGITFMNNEFDALRFLFFYISNTNYIVVLGIFVLFLYALQTRFSLLNEAFESTFFPAKQKGKLRAIGSVQKPKNLSDCVARFGNLYATLNDAIDLLNLCCSFQIMLCCGLFFVYTIFTIFAAYRTFINYEEGLLYTLVSSLCWNVLYFAYVTSVIALGSKISNEGKNTTTLVHKAINTINYGDIIERLFYFSQQVGQRIPCITCGLFPFDWTLFFSISAATTTYLVILIQFEASM